MNNIEPAYVTFEQAKWLKELGFDVRLKSWFDSEGEFHILNDEFNSIGWFNRNLPKDECSRPEQWQVVEWLRVNHNIWIEASLIKDFTYTPLKIFWYGRIINLNKEEDDIHNTEEFNTPQEAYSAAFDYIKENNLI
jgi:hypothetical protein